jgi:hypothetical protein
MSAKKENTYICGLCGTEHETLSERIKCEYHCLLEKEREDKRQQQIENQKKRDEKIKAIKDQIRMLRENEESLHIEYINTIEKRKSLEKELNYFTNNSIINKTNPSFFWTIV